jgi:hypothetical protein
MIKLEELKNKKNIGIIVAIIVISIVFIGVIIYLFWFFSRSENNQIKNMDNLYITLAPLKSISLEIDPNKIKTSSNDNNDNNNKFSYNLLDYYIKTAYNCCAVGEFKNSFVNISALKNCIKEGVRCLDFEIYSVKNMPVVGVSSQNNVYELGSYNNVSFTDAMNTISRYAFTPGNCPNYNDPLILYFRIMSNNSVIYDIMASIILNSINSRLLSTDYIYGNGNKNLGTNPIINFNGKVIIVVNTSNISLENSPKLREIINLTCEKSSPFLKELRYTEVKNEPDMSSLIDFNKTGMTIVLPDLSFSNDNKDSRLASSNGCQMNAMSFQNYDTNLQYYNKQFEDYGYAFILKPEELRHIPSVIKSPTAPPEKYSFKERNVKSDFYSFTI